MTVTMHPRADQYLRRLERTARALPRGQRDELLAEIRSHLELGLAPDATEAQARNFLDDLGTPEEIVAAARPDHVPTRRGAREILALVLLVIGFPPVLGWIVGVVLLVSSPLWSTRQKLLGILVWPGGGATLLAGFALALFAGLPSALYTVAMIVFLLAPLVVAVYLYGAAGRQADAV